MTQLSEETIKTSTEISDPKNADKFTAKSALEALEIQMKSCQKCKHHKKVSVANICSAFKEDRYCLIERQRYGDCKQEALMFEPKPVAKSKFRECLDYIKTILCFKETV